MLINRVISSRLLLPLQYSISLHANNVKQHFDNNFTQARALVKNIADKFKLNDEKTKKYFAYYPLAFKPGTPQNKFLNERANAIKEMGKRNDEEGVIGRALEDALFDCDKLAFNLSDEDLGRILNKIKEVGMTESQIKNIFRVAPNLINPKFGKIIDQKLHICQNYLKLTREESLELFQSSPFLLPCSSEKLKRTILFYEAELNYSKGEIIHLAKILGEALLIHNCELSAILKFFNKLGIKRQEQQTLLKKHPLLLLNSSDHIFPMKLKIFRYLQMRESASLRMLRQFPQILIYSVGSLEAKALFLKKRLFLPLNKVTIELFKYNYNEKFRPRGELLLKTRTPFKDEKIVELMSLSDEEFVQQIGVTGEHLSREQNRFEITHELDFRKRKVLRNSNSQQRIINLAKQYYS